MSDEIVTQSRLWNEERGEWVMLGRPARESAPFVVPWVTYVPPLEDKWLAQVTVAQIDAEPKLAVALVKAQADPALFERATRLSVSPTTLDAAFGWKPESAQAWINGEPPPPPPPSWWDLLCSIYHAQQRRAFARRARLKMALRGFVLNYLCW